MINYRSKAQKAAWKERHRKEMAKQREARAVRNAKVIDLLLKTSMSASDVGKLFNMTRENVRLILKKNGYDPHDLLSLNSKARCFKPITASARCVACKKDFIWKKKMPSQTARKYCSDLCNPQTKYSSMAKGRLYCSRCGAVGVPLMKAGERKNSTTYNKKKRVCHACVRAHYHKYGHYSTKEQQKEWSRRYHEKHPERRKEWQKRRYEKIKADPKKWAEYLAYYRNRYAKCKRDSRR